MDGYKRSSDYTEFKQYQNAKQGKSSNYSGFFIFLMYAIFTGSTIYAQFDLRWEVWVAVGYALCTLIYFFINSGDYNV